MTVFITPCLRNAPSFEAIKLRRLLMQWCVNARLSISVLVMILGMMFVPSVQSAPVVELQNLKIEREESSVYLSANWNFDLPTVLDDALLKGVALYFVMNAEISQERWYFYNKRISAAEKHIRLYYQPLMRRWRVQVSTVPFSSSGLGMNIGQSFDSLEEAIAAVRRVSQWRIANTSDVTFDGKQTITLNFRLDLNQLPRPLQIGAVGQSDWNISARKVQRLEVVSP